MFKPFAKRSSYKIYGTTSGLFQLQFATDSSQMGKKWTFQKAFTQTAMFCHV